MSNILAKTPKEQEKVVALLNKNVPTFRQAYSDRTAWLMACLSELAYIRFNPLLMEKDKQKKYFLERIAKLVGDNKKQSLIKLIDIVAYDPEAEKQNLIDELDSINMELVETFDEDGTQAILVSSDQFIVLAFRGTEATSIKDIKSDADARTTQCETGGNIHSGFNKAFAQIEKDIRTSLNKDDYKNKPLFITGHSLGGALATIAAKKLSDKIDMAACYTFGSPRVGNDEWIASIKTPIYRLVNAADCVTMLPPGDDTMSIVCWILKVVSWFRIPFISRPAKSLRTLLLSKFKGYLHCGDMRYMTNCKLSYNEVKLLYAVSLLRRIKGLVIKKLPGKHFLKDHSMSVYRKKLMVIAEKHNQK